MRVYGPIVVLAVFGLADTSACAADAGRGAIELCDRMAASPDDRDRPPTIVGVEDDAIAPEAISVCRAALATVTVASGSQAAVDLRRVQYELARALDKVEQYAEARAWYERAALAGNVEAMANLGVLYENGLGVARNPVTALRWYEKAASAGSVGAMVGLGVRYENGLGVARDLSAARRWYEQAAAAGSATAMFDLGVLYETGRGGVPDYALARSWYERAAAQGNAEAMFNLGVYYAEGHGVAVDAVAARDWLKKGAANGSSASRLGLIELVADSP